MSNKNILRLFVLFQKVKQTKNGKEIEMREKKKFCCRCYVDAIFLISSTTLVNGKTENGLPSYSNIGRSELCADRVRDDQLNWPYS